MRACLGAAAAAWMVMGVSPAWAQSGLGTPTYGGSGCPADSASIVDSGDGSAMTMLFDAYEIETEQDERHARASCTVKLPISVPSNMRLKAVDVDYRGYAYVPEKSMGRFSCVYKVNGEKHSADSMGFKPGFDDDFQAGHGIEGPKKDKKFKCGESVNFDVTTHLFAMKRGHKKHWINQEEQFYAAVDSADYSISFAAHFEPCDGPPPSPPSPPAPAGGAWHAAPLKQCKHFCSSIGKKNVPSPDGALCTSGEQTVGSAINAAVPFKWGCWPGNCQTAGHGKSPTSTGAFCYAKGQKKDFDKTDRTVGCYCAAP